MGHRLKRHRSSRRQVPQSVSGVARQGIFLLVALGIVATTVFAGTQLLPEPPPRKGSKGKAAFAQAKPEDQPKVADTPKIEPPAKEKQPEPKEMTKGEPTTNVTPEKPKEETKTEPKETAKVDKPEVKPEPPKPEPPKPDPNKPTKLVVYEDLVPLFKAKCVLCHGDPSVKGGLDMRTLAGIKKGGDNGPSVQPGDLKKSDMWERIESGEMPPKDAKDQQLTAMEKQLIKDWILGGCKEAKDVPK
jgi:hypothetical protein